jgi:oligoendopeptidase F
VAEEARLVEEKPSEPEHLPIWDLSDLYAGMDAPEVRADLERAARLADAFEARLKGRLGEIAGGPEGGLALAAAIQEYERIEEILGRLGSFAGLLHAGDTSDPKRAKFFGDVQDRLTAISTHLLFFELELNRLDDALIEEALKTPALARYRPWIRACRSNARST